MRRLKSINILCIFLVLVFLLSACSFSKGSSTNQGGSKGNSSNQGGSKRSEPSFSIQFIDVGQGDAALVQCDGKYMLIDGGDTTAGDKVYQVLVDKGILKLEYLVISHLHKDHFGGLTKALSYASSIGKTLSNATEASIQEFLKFEHQLGINGSQITVPHVGEQFKLGSAVIEVVDVSNADPNDSLVLLITYKNTRFLFTGDIGKDAQRRVFQKYRNDKDEPYKIDLIKMPHHGADLLILFVETFMPDYAVISVGKGNIYGHPYQETLDMLEQADSKVYRTDLNGDILVTSDGKTVSVKPSK